MAISYLKGAAHPIHLWTDVETVESVALDQLRNIANLPYVHHHVAVMPDVHFGKGATVGSVVAMKDAVAPSAVGVDIGCGMAAIRTNLRSGDLPDSLSTLRSKVEAAIPVSHHAHTSQPRWVENLPLWNDFKSLHEGVQDRFSKAIAQMGTLGGGNHFIELCVDQHDRVWLLLHSGSRNIGKEIAERHIKIAKTLEHNAKLPDPDLAVFLAGTPEMAAYRNDLMWAQGYAFSNRTVMLDHYQKVLTEVLPEIRFGEVVNCHHNYVSEEHHYDEDVLVTRKGAISARFDEWGIIPGSMGTRSYIVRGKGNPEAFNSAPHGAGRVMSRGKAKKSFTIEDLATQTSGVECRKDAGVLDEIPGAYKNIDVVINQSADLVEVLYELRQVLCVKG